MGEFEEKLKDELKKEFLEAGAVVDVDTLEKISVLELNSEQKPQNFYLKKYLPGYKDYGNGQKSGE